MSETEAEVSENQQVESAETSSTPTMLAGKYKDVDALEVGYKELEAKLGEKPELETDKLKEEWQAELRADVPATAEEYNFVMPEGILPEGQEITFKGNDPIMQEWKEFAHRKGLTPAEFNEATALYVRNELAQQPDIPAEMEKLGENAQARLDRVDMWSARHLSAEAYGGIVRSSDKAELVMAMEEIMQLTKDVSLEGNDAGPSGQTTLAELQEMQGRVRKMKAGAEREALNQKVSEGFKRLTQAR